MPENFGARLRQRREEQHIALNAIAEQTKIKMSLLEALERGDVSHWPSGIFRRAFIRAYAKAIALNPDVVVREFLAVHPDPAEIVETAPVAVMAGHTTGGPPTRLALSWGRRLALCLDSGAGPRFRIWGSPTPLPSPRPTRPASS
jgi:transcriptional regulator with XRE-family HTH domain